MNIIKFGGSIVNPDGRYDEKVINEFIKLVNNSKDKFIFVVGGGKLCRKVQDASKRFLQEALKNEKEVEIANDELGLAVTKINAHYVLHRFQEKLGDIIYPDLIIDPTIKIKSNCKVFFATGWKPGCSTDKDMMLLAETFGADRVTKISDFEIVKRIKPTELAKLKDKKKALDEAEEISEMTWSELKELVGEEWLPGLHTPFDPGAMHIGFKLRKKLIILIGRREELSKMLNGEKYSGTIVKV